MTGTFHVPLRLLVPVRFHKFNVPKVKSPEGLLTVHLMYTDNFEFIREHSSNMSGRERKDGTVQSNKHWNHSRNVIIAMPTDIDLFRHIHISHSEF